MKPSKKIYLKKNKNFELIKVGGFSNQSSTLLSRLWPGIENLSSDIQNQAHELIKKIENPWRIDLVSIPH